MRGPLVERFWVKVTIAGEGECWEWTGYRSSEGYGRIYDAEAGGPVYAHRVAYALEHGSVPEGLTIDHLCRVRHCVNPKHLQAITLAENSALAQLRKTHCYRGHPFSVENTYREKDGGRRCRTCALAWMRAKYAAKKAKSNGGT